MAALALTEALTLSLSLTLPFTLAEDFIKFYVAYRRARFSGWRGDGKGVGPLWQKERKRVLCCILICIPASTSCQTTRRECCWMRYLSMPGRRQRGKALRRRSWCGIRTCVRRAAWPFASWQRPSGVTRKSGRRSTSGTPRPPRPAGKRGRAKATVKEEIAMRCGNISGRCRKTRSGDTD